MNNRKLVDPELLVWLDRRPYVIPTDGTLGKYRGMINELVALRPPTDPQLLARSEYREEYATGINGAPNIKLLIYRPADAVGPLPVFMHVHGGGFIAGDAAMSDPTNRAYAVDMNCVVVSVDYRLSPEVRYPGSLEDCLAALHWLNTEADPALFDRSRIAIGGESAGAGLAAAVTLKARDTQMPLPVFQYLLAPMLDDRSAVRVDWSPHIGDFGWTREHNRFAWATMLGAEPGTGHVSAYASPARAESLAGLPPTYIHVGALDLFTEECVEYARRLVEDGTSVELHVWPGAYHSFEMFNTTVSQSAMTVARAALRRALHP